MALEELLQGIPVPQYGAVDPAVGALHVGHRHGAMAADELGRRRHLEPVDDEVQVGRFVVAGAVGQFGRGFRIAPYQLVEERRHGVLLRRPQIPQIPVHLLVQVGGEQQVLVVGEAVAEREDRVAEGVAAGDDANDARVFEAGQVVAPPQGLQHVAYAVGFAPRMIQVDVYAEAFTDCPRHPAPEVTVNRRLTGARVAHAMWQT